MRRCVASILLLAFACAGCATPPPASRNKQPVDFRSAPPGAEVLLDGTSLGQSPVEDVMVSKETHRVTLRKLGYAELTAYIAPRPRNPFVHLFTLGFLLNTAEFDALDSSYMFTLEPDKPDQK